jgi:HTH-type transcriptional regulator/antitoxin HigA
MNVKVIKNRSEYDAALERVIELMDRNPSPGSEEENTLELLLLVIRDYEQKVIEPIGVDSIEAIKFRMDQMQITRKELVPFIGSMSKVSEILSGKRNLSLTMIRKLHQGLGIPLESLLVVKTRKKRVLKKRRASSLRKRKRHFSS